MTEATLRVWRVEGCTLARALAQVPAVHGGAALLATPRRYEVAIAGAAGCATAGGAQLAIDAVFEARCFTPRAELRWLRDPRSAEGHGTMVLLSEDATAGASLGAEATSIAAVETIGGGTDASDAAHGYLLWGELDAEAPVDGAWRFRDGRVGVLAVPEGLLAAASRAARRRARLLVREYVAVEATHGNSHVAEERLLGLAWTD